ncbi:MAG: hypothetical protein M1817_002255 [Caeruleum heppii]|nr:MAG: hypothetical protein M1817_002255 [Caeruleum heppii]
MIYTAANSLLRSIRRQTFPSSRLFSRGFEASSALRTNRIFTLPDGRSLGYAEYGSLRGTPVIFFHGLPSSRFEGAEWDDLGKKYAARIIAVDRPGMGLSTFQPQRKILDWPSDVQQLAQQLQLGPYRVMGSSGGGPYALACAKMLPRESLRGVTVLAGMGPWKLGTKGMTAAGRVAWNLATWFPALSDLMIDRYTVSAVRNPNPEVFAKQLEKALKKHGREKDIAVFANEDYLQLIVDAMREAYRPGYRGYSVERRLLTSSWGFELDDVPFEGVRLYYGTEDEHTPITMGRYMAEHLKSAVLKEYTGDTHWTITINHSEEILRDILRDES